VHLAFLDLLSVDGFTSLGSPEFGDELSVFFLGDIEFSLCVVFELWVVEHLLGNALASEKPDSFNLKVGFFSQNSHHCECVGSEVVDSLEESVHEVLCLVENNTFTFVLFVVNEVDGVSLWVVGLEEFLHAFSFLVWEVNKESLEFWENKFGGWE
jgi:hypothetical protein